MKYNLSSSCHRRCGTVQQNKGAPHYVPSTCADYLVLSEGAGSVPHAQDCRSWASRMGRYEEFHLMEYEVFCSSFPFWNGRLQSNANYDIKSRRNVARYFTDYNSKLYIWMTWLGFGQSCFLFLLRYVTTAPQAEAVLVPLSWPNCTSLSVHVSYWFSYVT
jgi:hypothetical protein